MINMITIKTPSEVALMRHAGLVVYEILNELESITLPGATTWDLEMRARDLIRKHKVMSAFKGYKGFPCVLCVSLDDEICHGIPSRKRIMEERSLVKLDFAVSYKGWFADAARTVDMARGSNTPEIVDVTKEALWAGIGASVPGGRVGDIGAAITKVLARYAGNRGFNYLNYYCTENYTGHGIGQAMHEYPPVPNTGEAGTGPLLQPGMTIAIEPMVCTNSHRNALEKDGWTVVTSNSELSAHFEHTIHITDRGPEILTLPEIK